MAALEFGCCVTQLDDIGKCCLVADRNKQTNKSPTIATISSPWEASEQAIATSNLCSLALHKKSQLGSEFALVPLRLVRDVAMYYGFVFHLACVFRRFRLIA